MRRIWYVVGALGVVTALAYARDTAPPTAIAGTPTPLSAASMHVIADEKCGWPAGYQARTVQMLRGEVVEVGVAATDVVICSVRSSGHSLVRGEEDASGAAYVASGTALVWDDEVLKIGRIAPEVAVLELVLPSGRAVKAELYGEVFLCRVPERITTLRFRAYDAGGRLLRDALI
ncbi:hypothetical protein ABZX92_40580 [Lentzea sp. NPDC006480]|uniref:hypothetical protein n=1 Tax=Lentzea sp. NPDC006480 TaxID=3157176 RepID=UPI0033A7E534